MSSKFTTELVSKILTDARHVPSQVFGVSDFAYDLEQASGLCTAPRDNQTRWVYRKNDTYALGWIGYGRWQDRSKTETYVVYSPYIVNNKYGHGDRTRMSMTTSRPTAVKNAMKYLRPLMPAHIMEQSRALCRDGFNAMLNTVKEQMARMATDLERNLFPTYYRWSSTAEGNTSQLRNELEHLVNSGYKFLDPAIGEQLSKYFGVMREASDISRRDPKFTFVEITPNPQAKGGATLRIVEGHDITSHMWTGVWTEKDPKMVGETYHAADAPEDVLQKIAVLNMVEDEHYVEGVGYRVCDRVFYLR